MKDDELADAVNAREELRQEIAQQRIIVFVHQRAGHHVPAAVFGRYARDSEVSQIPREGSLSDVHGPAKEQPSQLLLASHDVSFDQIQWTYPQIDPSDLLGGLMKQLVG